VLAWPAHLFHNYGALLRELAIDTEEVAFRFHEVMALLCSCALTSSLYLHSATACFFLLFCHNCCCPMLLRLL
jgi:hypothetical protein